MDRRRGCAVAPSCCLQPHWGSYEEVVVGARMPVNRPFISSMRVGSADQHAAEHASTLLAKCHRWSAIYHPLATGSQLYISTENHASSGRLSGLQSGSWLTHTYMVPHPTSQPQDFKQGRGRC